MVITSNLLQTFALLVHVLVFVQMNDISLNSFAVILFLLCAFWFNDNFLLTLSQLRMPLICFSQKSGIDFYLGFSRGGGVLNKVLYGEAPPRGPTPYPFIYHFWQKSYPFRIYLLLTNGTPFTYQVNPLLTNVAKGKFRPDFQISFCKILKNK